MVQKKVSINLTSRRRHVSVLRLEIMLAIREMMDVLQKGAIGRIIDHLFRPVKITIKKIRERAISSHKTFKITICVYKNALGLVRRKCNLIRHLRTFTVTIPVVEPALN